MTEPSSKLLAKQQQLQRSIERSLDNFKKIGRSNLTPAKIRSRISTLKETWLLFLNGHADLLKMISEAHQASISYFKDNLYEMTEECCHSALDYMAECLEELEPPISLNQSVQSPNVHASTSAVSLSHLPPINIQPFDSNYDQWEHFRDRFTSLIIQNTELRNFTRMHYLTSSLKGGALECIKELAVTGENFEVAWKSLTARYENKRRRLGVHLSSLLNLASMPRESATGIQTLLDKLAFAQASLKNLNRNPAELWQDMLVHLISHKLDSTTLKAWNLKSSDSDVPPSVNELVQFLTCRLRALEACSLQSNSVSLKSPGNAPPKRISATTASSFEPASVSVMTSASVKANATSSAPCPICKAQHYFNACSVWRTPMYFTLYI